MSVAYLFIDANVFLHYKWQEIPWRDVAGADEVFLVVPLAVTSALDRLKEDHRYANRAKAALKQIDRVIDDEASEFRPGVKFHVPHEEPRDFATTRLDPSVPDDRIIACIREFSNPAGYGRKLLVAADRGIRVKAKHHNIECIVPDDERKLPSEEDPEVVRLRKENARLTAEANRRPVLSVSFADGASHLAVELTPVLVTQEMINAQVQSEYQKLSPIAEARIRRICTDVSDGYQNARQTEAVRSGLRDHQLELEEYLKSDAEVQGLKSLAFQFEVHLWNNGTARATALSVTFSPSPEVVLSERLRLPAKPLRPVWSESPKYLEYVAAKAHAASDLDLSELESPADDYNPGPKRWNARQLQHGSNQALKLWASFSRVEDIGSFSLTATIRADELPSPISCELQFNVRIKNA